MLMTPERVETLRALTEGGIRCSSVTRAGPGSRLHRRRVGVEARQCGVARLGWQWEDGARDAGRRKRLQRRPIGRRVKQGHRYGLRIASRFLQSVAQLWDPSDRIHVRSVDRHPPVTEFHDTIEG